jgi:hypothetical protein
METNYIIHLNSSFKRFADDENATPFHISLYMALFHKWNSAKFRNPISIARDDLMFLSKIGSTNTYTKCLKELDKWGYIKYTPSHSYHVGSKIYLYTFGTTKKPTTTKTTDISTNKTTDKTTDKTRAQDVRPYINSLNNTNKTNNTNKLNSVNTSSPTSINKKLINPKKDDESKRKKVAPKKETQQVFADSKNATTKTSLQRPTLEEIKNYFASKLSTELESEKFFNYFESNGWLVGGKTPMKNWQAAANNWIINVSKFNNNDKNKQTPQQYHTAGKLHASTDKNFSEPL